LSIALSGYLPVEVGNWGPQGRDLLFFLIILYELLRRSLSNIYGFYVCFYGRLVSLMRIKKGI